MGLPDEGVQGADRNDPTIIPFTDSVKSRKKIIFRKLFGKTSCITNTNHPLPVLKNKKIPQPVSGENAVANQSTGKGLTLPAVQAFRQTQYNQSEKAEGIPNGQPVQLFGFKGKGYLIDSWYNWSNKFNEGDEEKWQQLEALYYQVKKNVEKSGEPEKSVKKEILKLDEAIIGYSEYEATLKTLYRLNLATDPQYNQDIDNLSKNNAYNNLLFENLKKHAGKDCPMTLASKYIKFEGKSEEIDMMKALLYLVYQSSFGQAISDRILKIISENLTDYTITFRPGAASEKQYGKTSSVVELALLDRDYATGEDGSIIVNSLEIVTVHELGHLVQDLDPGYRGTPKKGYGELSTLEKKGWSDEEEYINITQVENEHRDSLKVPKRLYHAGDPLVQFTVEELKFIFTNREEWNINMLLLARDKDDDSDLVKQAEVMEFHKIRELYKKDSGRSIEETAELRWLCRRNSSRINKIRNMDYAGKFSERKLEADKLLLKKPSWKKKLLPDTDW